MSRCDEMAHGSKPCIGGLRLDDLEFKASLGYAMGPCVKAKDNRKPQTNRQGHDSRAWPWNLVTCISFLALEVVCFAV